MVETAIWVWGRGGVAVEVEVSVSEWGSAVLGNRERGGLGGIGAVFGGGEGRWDGIRCGGWGRGERKFVDGVGRGGGDVISNRRERSKGKGRGGRPVGQI